MTQRARCRTAHGFASFRPPPKSSHTFTLHLPSDTPAARRRPAPSPSAARQCHPMPRQEGVIVCRSARRGGPDPVFLKAAGGYRCKRQTDGKRHTNVPMNVNLDTRVPLHLQWHRCLLARAPLPMRPPLPEIVNETFVSAACPAIKLQLQQKHAQIYTTIS